MFTCALAVMSSLACMVMVSKASVGSFSHGSINPGPSEGERGTRGQRLKRKYKLYLRIIFIEKDIKKNILFEFTLVPKIERHVSSLTYVVLKQYFSNSGAGHPGGGSFVLLNIFNI